jgi:hypothetical protein
MLVTSKITRTLMVFSLVAVAAPAPAQEDVPEPTPAPRFQPGYGMNPEARATMRAQRREEQEQLQERRRQQRLQNQENAPLMRPGGRMQPAAVGGKPVGGSCPSGESCSLEYKVQEGQVVTITAVWGPASLRCDDLEVSLSTTTAPIAPWWRCERTLAVEGVGVGYVGFSSPR